MSYGYLSGNPHAPKAGIAGGGAPAYSYGWPSGGTLEPDVIAQWTFNVASGNVTDAVGGSLVLTGAGTRTYSVSSLGYYTLSANTGVSLVGVPKGYFIKDASGLTLATGSGTIELVSTSPSTASKALLGCYAAGAGGLYAVYYVAGPDRIQMSIYASDGTTVVANLAMPSTYVLGKVQKLRVVLERATTNTIYAVLDGEATGTVSIATLAGKAIGLGRVVVGADMPVSTYSEITAHEIRFSGNATNNSGGPGGG